MDILGETKIDFLGKRSKTFVLSGIFVALGLIAIVLIAFGKANLGTDFTGGVQVQYSFEKPFAIDDIRKVLEGAGLKEAHLQELTGANKLMVRVELIEGKQLNEIAEGISKIFTEKMPGNTFIVEGSIGVGPTVGAKLQRDALFAIFVSLLFIMMYVAWRFEFRFGIASVIATFHDVLVVIGTLFILNVEINLLIITALLTLAGYSLTDTVVVFDRIRENLRRQTGEKLEPLVNRSINEVLRRTIVTSFTTLLVLAAIMALGGDVLYDFAFTLFIGVMVGTYSSIFVASPVLILWRGGKGKLIKEYIEA